MPRLESDKVERALLVKMKAERLDSADWRFVIYNDQGIQLSVTRLSKGAKHTLGDSRVSLMARQLGFRNGQQFSNFVSCTLSREEALKIIESNVPPVGP